jgi:chemosensory pili system protein ChpA (sensor histidine kinase/response regulator)
MEERVARVAGAGPEERGRILEALDQLAAGLKQVLDGIGDTGEEDADAIAALLSANAEPARPDRESAAGPVAERLAQLDGFFADNPDVLEYFVPEALGHLELMGQSLLILEREGPSAAEVARLFRVVHTLKGAAYTVGCPVIGDLAHRIEDLLGEVREEPRALTPTAIEAVFAGLDALRLFVRSAHGAGAGRGEALVRAMTLLDGLGPATVAAPGPTSPPTAVAIPESVAASELPAPRLVVADTEGARPGPTQRPDSVGAVRPNIRVNLDRLDALMNLVGELVIARSRLERRLGRLDQVGDLLTFTGSRMRRVVDEFERKYLDPRLPGGAGPGVASLAQSTAAIRREPPPDPLPPIGGGLVSIFGELEFDRYDDVGILARRVREIVGDVAEIQGQLAGLVREVREDASRVQQLSTELRSEVTRARMVPLGRLFARFSRQVREAARAAGKQVVLEISGETVEIDNAVIEQIADPLTHLIQNAVVHGIENEHERQRCGKPPHGTLRLAAAHRGGGVIIEIADDGRGIDAEAVRAAALRGGFVTPAALAGMSERDVIDLIFLPGCSTAPVVTTAAGRGVGMDVVRTNIGRLGGDVEVETALGQGTRFTIRLPLTMAISDALLVRLGSEVLGIPVPVVKAMVRVEPEAIRRAQGREAVDIEGQEVELLRLEHVLKLPSLHPGGPRPVVVARTGRRTLALAVDALLGKEDVVVKPLGAFLDGVGPFAGATVSGEGRVILLLDPLRLLEAASGLETSRPHAVTATSHGTTADARRRVLLVDDSVSVRRFVGQMLDRAGFAVATANDGADALQRLVDESFDVVVTDLEMPRLDGYELIRDIKRRPASRHTPIVVLTTRAGEKHVGLARQLGVHHYVTKPVDEQLFVRLVDSLATPAPTGVAV